ncbi:MAG: hypothetical protein BWY31_03097 [Lentisphaerae bacterium ADurb.Bin242]|nr:MAG: hypothetical protein BWY31_03097 [Lentisphaerae bacterium ADurb.Bin242]
MSMPKKKSGMKIGIAETTLNVPLFAELYGYGPFLGRRNRGTRDPLYCRVMSFTDGRRRNMIVVTDGVVTDDGEARALRTKIAKEFETEPDGIMFAATHTHSGPAMSSGIGWGEKSEEYLRHWRRTVIATVRKALQSEEEVTAFAGIAPLSRKLGVNRVNPKRPTDPSIRWIQFKRKNGTVKALLHNHGMHGVVFGRTLLVSADWMGEANRLIKSRKLADTPFFLYGAAGNINTEPCCKQETEGEELLKRIGKSYVDDLEKSLKAGGKEISLHPLQNALERVRMPTVEEDSAQMRENAETVRKINPFLADRFEEMAILHDRGKRFPVRLDLQVLRMGDVAVYAFPGEPFVELGRRIMEESAFPFAMPVGVANGNGRYFPTPETFDMFPDGLATRKASYGFYEIYQGAGRFMPRYDRNIADFIVTRLLNLNLK